MDLALFAEVLVQGLKLLNAKDSTKYVDKVIKLKKEYYNELLKQQKDRSDLKLDSILDELRIIAKTFADYPKPDNSKK
jgi:hypothetical protein